MNDIVEEIDHWLAAYHPDGEFGTGTAAYIKRARDEIVRLRDAESVLFQQLEACMKRVGQARAAALEEAAQVVEELTYPHDADPLDEAANAIRALKDKQ